MPLHLLTDFQIRCRELLDTLAEVRQEGRTLLFLDEVNFTKLSFQNKDWSGKNTSLTVDQKDIYTGYRSVIVTMTEERGLELCLIFDQAVNGEMFIDFL